MFVDHYVPLVQGAQSTGVVNHFAGRSFDTGLRRPYLDKYDRPAVTINTGRWTTVKGERKPIKEHVPLRDLILNGTVPPVFNATALRKEEWIELDRVVLQAARYPLRAWADLAAAGTYSLNGMGKMLLEHETMSDPGEAVIDMNGLTEGRNDSPLFQLQGLPLPITHCDFWFDQRRLMISRNSGSPIDTAMGEAAGRRVAEAVEKQTIGNVTGPIYGGNSTHVGGYGRTSQVYGYLTFPTRLTKTNITAPTGASWVPSTLQTEFQACLNQLRAAKFFGPFMVYHSTDWSQYLDGDYYVSITSGAVAPTKTLRDRLKAIDGIQDIRRLDFLFPVAPQTNPYYATTTQTGTTGQLIYTGPGGEGVTAAPFTFIFVQMTPNVARAVNGMDITTMQWESVGGMRLNFKVMAIQVPQLRADFYGNCGILQATTS